MKFLRELTEDVQFITEGEDGEKSCFIEGIFMQAEKQNRNGRVYPKRLLESEVNRYNRDFVSKMRAVGELGHPQGPTINEERVSHIITELKFEGNDVYGKAKILDTPNGRIVKTFMKEGILMGVSSRGVGAVQKSSHAANEVSNFVLSTVDIVSNPSGIDCFVNSVMENVEWVYNESLNGWESVQIAENVKKHMHASKMSEQQKINAFQAFIDSLKKN